MHGMKDFIVLANQDDDDALWQEQRRKYLTGSDMFKFVPPDVLMQRGWWVEQWIARTDDGEDRNLHWAQQEVFRRKMTGEDIEFKNPQQVHWGRYMEEIYRKAFSEFSGLPTISDHRLYHNERWPYLATSLDGWVMRPTDWTALEQPEMFTNPDAVTEAILELPEGEWSLLEIKTTSDFGVKKWVSGTRTKPRSKIIAGRFAPMDAGVPVYYIPQVLTQMAIRGTTTSLALVHGGMSTMTCHAMHLDDEWLDVMDRINDHAKPQLDLIRSWIQGEDNEQD